LLRRTDFAAAAMRLGDVGFVEHHTATRTLFLDGPTGKPSSATEIVFDDEPVVGKSPSYHSPGISSIVNIASRHVIALDSLVRFQLARYRLDDAVDLRDMLDVELIDESWTPRLPEDLAARLQHLIDTPDG
jgi:hypothetical protein